MKKLLSVLLGLCLLLSMGATTALAEGELPASMTALEGLEGYKVFVYQDLSASGLSMWVSDDTNEYSIADGKLTLTNWGVWSKGKVEQAGEELTTDVLAAAEGFGYYVESNSIGMWLKSSYYVQSTNEVPVALIEQPYFLIPKDGSEIIEGITGTSGQFLIPAFFEGFVMLPVSFSELGEFSPYPIVEGNLNITSDDSSTAAVFDDFFVFATAPEETGETPTPTDPPVQTGDASMLLVFAAGFTAFAALIVIKARKCKNH